MTGKQVTSGTRSPVFETVAAPGSALSVGSHLLIAFGAFFDKGELRGS